MPAKKQTTKIITSLIVIALAIGVGAYTAINHQPESIEVKRQIQEFEKIYSFENDSDKDGLSDAKEIIYGADKNTPDTDKDGTPDGQEVKNGRDPTQTGEATLEQAKQANFTIHYFQWAKTQKNINDPRLKSGLIEEFFKEKEMLDFQLPDTSKDQIAIIEDSTENIQRYLLQSSQIELPQLNISYQKLASNILQGKSTPQARRILQGVEDAKNQFNKLKVPASTVELHQIYLGILQELETMFAELNDAQKDPIKMSLNQKKGDWIASQSQKITKMQRQILEQLEAQKNN